MYLLEKYTNSEKKPDLSKSDIASLIYHNIFNYPLTQSELIRWTVGKRALKIFDERSLHEHFRKIKLENKYYFFKDNNLLIFQRILRKRIGERKKEIARVSSKILSLIPSIKFVGLTGALSMDNAGEDSDIDFLIITKKGTLWSTRLISYLILKLFGIKVRKYKKHPSVSDQKDKLCLNMWLDESNLAWRGKRNLFTSHEIAQITPLFNSGGTYEKFICINKWVKNFWPNSININYKKPNASNRGFAIKLSGYAINIICFIFQILNPLFYKFQNNHMKKRITREVVTPSKAIFHPVDWNKIVSKRLKLLIS